MVHINQPKNVRVPPAKLTLGHTTPSLKRTVLDSLWNTPTEHGYGHGV